MGSVGEIRIEQVRVHLLSAPLKQRFGWSLGWTDRRTATLVEVITDSGLTGWGDGNYGGELLRSNPGLVIGRSPFEVEAIYEALRPPSRAQSRRGPATAGGLDVALWDVAGKALGMPVWRLLGPCHRDRIRPYCTALYRRDWPDLAAGLAEEALTWKQRGFEVIKMKIGYGPDLDVRLVRAVREAIGDETGLAVDSNCAYDVSTALALGRRLEEFNLLWWEEPLLADDLAGYARLKTALRIPLAGGETLPADDLIRDYIQPRLVDIVQPEIEITGFTGGRQISHSCWLNHVRLIPHNWSTALRTAAILHWMATVPPLTEAIAPQPALFEFDQTENPLRDAVLQERLAPAGDGCIRVPDAPGLGVTVVPEALEPFRTGLIVIKAVA